jgi:hypothetical protein
MKAPRIRSLVTLSGAATVLTLCLFVGSHAFESPVYDSRLFDNIYVALSEIGEREAVLLIKSQSRVQNTFVFPVNITLRFQEKGSLFVESGKTVTIDSPIEAGASKIFDGDGKVILRGGKAYSEWWGAQGDGIHDDGYAIQAAIEAVYAGGGGVVHLRSGTYLLNHIAGKYYALRSKNKVSVMGEGNTSILKIGDDLRTSTQGVAILYNDEELVSQCSYAHFSVDYNGKANLRLASWGKDAVSNVSRLGARFASEILIEDLQFMNVTGAHCIYIGNQETNHDITIKNCVVRNVGQSVKGNQIRDHSSIYVGGTHCLIADNVFQNDLPCDVSTGIEVHCSHSVVINNSISNYAHGLNIAAEANNASNLLVKGNTLTNCRYGVVLWHYGQFILNDVTIRSNDISIRDTESTPYPPSSGIIYGGTFRTSVNNLQGLIIDDNVITQATVTADSSKPNTAIRVEAADHVTIFRNTIYNISGEAIYIASPSADQGLHSVAISNNNIRNVGLTSTKNRKRAIAFNSYSTSPGSITNIVIRNNSIAGSKKSPMLYGVAFNNGLFPYVEIRDNSISDTISFEILNKASAQGSVFHIFHAGRGFPGTNLQASPGSRWTDLSTGRIFKY